MLLALDSAFRRSNPWLALGGSVLIVAVLAQLSAVLIPLAVASLLTFLLTPLATRLQRRLGRLASVAIVVVGFGAVCAGLTALGAVQLGALANELPSYRSNIRSKISDVRVLTEGGFLGKIDQLVSDIQGEIEEPDDAPEVVVQSSDAASNATELAAPLLAFLANAAIVFVLVTFMLLERQQLRDRVVRLFGHTRLATTTKAIDEAGSRVSRYLYAQLLVNASCGVVVGAGLYFIGLPYALLWGCLAALLRFVPYVGPWLAAIPPILLSLAVTPGWGTPLVVLTLYVVLELFTNMVLETYLYAGVAGISQVGLLVAILFWSWLWGPAGLLLAAPLTVVLVVVGNHVPMFRVFSDLMTDSAVPDTPGRYYQRLLAGDQMEAAEILQEHARLNPTENVFDALMLPALTFAERDVAAGILSADEEDELHKITGELLTDFIEARGDEGHANSEAGTPLVSLFPVNQKGDALACRMLADLLADTAIEMEIGTASLLHAEIVQLVKQSGSPVICIADLPPGASSKARYLVRRIRTALPDVRIIVGRWAPPSLADDDTSEILAAGANHVPSSLAETRELLIQMNGLQNTAR